MEKGKILILINAAGVPQLFRRISWQVPTPYYAPLQRRKCDNPGSVRGSLIDEGLG